VLGFWKKKKNIHAYFAILVFQCFSKGNKKFGLLKIHTNKQTSKGTKKQVFNNNNSLLLLTFVLFFCLFTFCFVRILTNWSLFFLAEKRVKKQIELQPMQKLHIYIFLFCKIQALLLAYTKKRRKKKEKQKEKNKQNEKKKQIL